MSGPEMGADAMSDDESGSVHERWARLRFAVIGRLLSAPPPRGELRVEIERLADQTWTHPGTTEPITFGFSTIERWYYQARDATDPVGALRNRVRCDRGRRFSLFSCQESSTLTFRCVESSR